MAIQCKQVLNPSTADLAKIQQIYETNFPASERKPFQTLQDGISSRQYICMTAHDTEAPDEILACAFLLPLANSPMLFLEYIAVDHAMQGRSIGSQMFRLMVEYFEAQQMGSAMIWEVEPPVADAPEDAANKRIRFYERLGAHILDYSITYAMPNYEDPADGPVPLRLMQLPLAEQPDKSSVIQLIDAIYVAAYDDNLPIRDAIIAELQALAQ